MAGVRVWLLALRPKTLSAAVVPVAVGSALAWAEQQRFGAWVLACALAATLFIQLATNLFNDAIDFARGADTEARLGPTRATQAGLLSPRQVMWGGVVCALLAALAGLPLVLQGGWVIVAIGLASLLCAYAYTGGPWPLAYLGLGDLFVMVFFGLVAVGGTYYLHTGAYSWRAALGGVQVGALATVLLAINNLRDVDGDRRVAKKTLAVRLGPGFARLEISLLLALPFALGALYGAGRGWLLAGLLPLLAAPLAWPIARGLWREAPGPVYNRFLARAALVQVLFGALLSLGLWLR